MYGEYNCTSLHYAAAAAQYIGLQKYFVTLSSSCLHSHIRLGGYNCLGVWAHHLFPINNQLGLRPSKEATPHWSWHQIVEMDTFTPTTRADVPCNVDHMFGLLFPFPCCVTMSLSLGIFSAWFWHQFSGMEDVQWRHVTITPSLINVFSRYCHFALFLCFLSLWILPLLPLSQCLLPRCVWRPWTCVLSRLLCCSGLATMGLITGSQLLGPRR